jgi:hypothetical protein
MRTPLRHLWEVMSSGYWTACSSCARSTGEVGDGQAFVRVIERLPGEQNGSGVAPVYPEGDFDQTSRRLRDPDSRETARRRGCE